MFKFKLKTQINFLKENRLYNDSFWALFGNIVGKGLSLLGGVLVARILGKNIYGEFEMLRTTIISVAMFSTYGLGYSVTKFVAQYKNSDTYRLRAIISYSMWTTLILSSVLAVLMFFFAKRISVHVLESTKLITPLRILAVLVISNALVTTQIGILAGFCAFKELARINIVVGLITFIISVVLTYYFSFEGTIGALLISQVINWFLNYNLVRKLMPEDGSNIKDQKRMFYHVIRFSTPIALQEALFSVTFWLTSVIIVRLSDFAELGLYAAAMQWYSIVLFLPGILRNVILSHLSESINDNVRHKNILHQTILINLFSTLACVLVIFVFSGYITKIYGSSYQGLEMIINIAILSSIFSSVSNVYAQAYLSKGKNWTMFFIRFFRDFGTLVIAYYYLRMNPIVSGAKMMVLINLLMNAIFFGFMAIYYNTFKSENQLA
jgi:O-antigen/teichoic acid export membrane protein